MAHAESTFITKKKNELKSIEKKIDQNNKIISIKRKKEKKAIHQLGYLKRRLRIESKKLTSTQHKLTLYKRKVTTTQRKLQKINRNYQVEQTRLSQRLVQLYKNQDIGFVEFFFSPSTYTQRINHSHYFDRILTKDTALVETLHQKKNEYSDKKARLEKQKNRIHALKKSLKKRKKTLASSSSKVKENLTLLRNEIKKFEDKNAALLEDSAEISHMIRQDSSQKRTYYGSGVFIKPTSGWISSRFGLRRHPIFKRLIKHRGVDFAAPKGRKINAAQSGYILYAGRRKGYGNTTIINHGWKNGKKLSTVYAHQWRLIAKKGQYVRKGQLIGYVGTSGYSTGPHLHFEIRENGTPVNPQKYMQL